MTILIGLWHRLTISLLWVCLSLFLHFTVQKRPMSGTVSGPSGASLAKRPHLECGNEANPSGK